MATGDIAGLIRHLRFNADSMELVEVAVLIESAAALSGFDDLREAAAAMAREQSPQQLYEFGYACIERGIPFLAIPALRHALELLPNEPAVLMELVAALEAENIHAEAVAALELRVESLDPWPARFLLAYNALLAGNLGRAEREAAHLPTPVRDWSTAHDRLMRMIARARRVRTVSPLDSGDLRGWCFALNGSLLITISPYGFHDGMNGRFAFTSDSFALCRRSLDRLQVILSAAGRHPTSVSLLPDRSSRILGLAAARMCGLPAEPFEPGRPDALVVAYNLNETQTEELRARADGQVLFEHASCWTDPPAVGADVVGFLHQVVTSPWGERHRVSPGGEVETVPPDQRPVDELAAEIVGAAPESFDDVDGMQVNPDAALVGLAAAVRDEWLTGPRDAVRSPGPVSSSRFV